ncbi:isopentenyl pyrophosphate isomerase [Klebsormidium nitens]|uniref:isopentenyl-diphosphate Delta-isomerase n=1 Tax=Klebsormidium nitens TaxID=105231 RepID=A0A1Y1IBE1_KLENI|nr:isopentenyl pyrophosphate isomerase [Klebsormidium nitens]|eukprot:GAQ88285.1 isopentenyl pyrophosphate isomerase [Klebsormidium nitens]
MDSSTLLRIAGQRIPRLGRTLLASTKGATNRGFLAVGATATSQLQGEWWSRSIVRNTLKFRAARQPNFLRQPDFLSVQQHYSHTLPRHQMAAPAGQDAVQWKLMNEDECILVNESDEVLGHDSKLNCHLWEKIQTGKVLHRAFSVFLFNTKNELLLQQRSATKVTFPLVWTNTCCSHPLFRESELVEADNLGVRNAAQRKLKDEVGIEAGDAPVDGFTVLGRILYKAPSNDQWGEHEVDYVLFAKRDVKVEPNPEEVAAVQYVTQDQLRELVAKADSKEGGIVLSPWFRLIVDKFLYKWWDLLEADKLSEAIDLQTIHKLS